MRFAIYGAGAVGALLGARLVETGQDVSFIARGRNLEALRERGLRVRSAVFGERRYAVRAVSSPEESGPADYVILGTKAHALPAIAPQVGPLRRRGTVFVSTQNGLPWWYFHGMQGAEAPLQRLDPDGALARCIPPEDVIGSIVYFSSSLRGPGEIEHSQGVRLPLGEPAGGRTERIRRLATILQAAGLKTPIRNEIRHELWVKLLGNATLNPLSALTRKTIAQMIAFPSSRRLIEAMMDEIRDVAAAVGVPVAISNEKRIDGARAAGGHKTSMLQDLEHGREPELEALLGAVLELAARHYVDAPRLETVYRAARLLFARPGP